MDNLGSEIGHKMRSAVKAKLIELGSGTSTGYIDDELPDYVMIMVANKRSKEQMVEDLSLFLNKNTEAFVNWLHQVLDKLQEVTLPATAIQKNKRKAVDINDKKDKKTKRKLKNNSKDKTAKKEPERSTTPPIQSITDVFADHLMQKAQKSLDRAPLISAQTKIEQAKKHVDETNDDFDIPTISEIAKNAVGEVVCRKELTELEELQKKINQAKKQLRQFTDESEDDDFINLQADKNDLVTVSANKNKTSALMPPPDDNTKQSNTNIVIDNNLKLQKEPITFDPRDKNRQEETEKDSEFTGTISNNKRSIHDRLGVKQINENIVSLSANRRMEQAIYVPAFRRTENNKRNDRERSKEPPLERRALSRERHNDIEKNREIRRSHDSKATRDLREKVRERSLSNRTPARSRELIRTTRNKDAVPLTRTLITKRIGSRVIVAPPRLEHSDEEIEMPINSVVKVQPRPVIPKSKQACKNLLLRAVAEAQKSTALVKPREAKTQVKRDGRELYTKSFRANKKILPKDNIIVEVAAIKLQNVVEIENTIDVDDEQLHEEEYVPSAESIHDDQFIYVPQSIHSDSSPSSNTKNRTQFVVTLDSQDYRNKKRHQRIENNLDNFAEQAKRPRKQSPLNVEISQKVNKLIIQNDTEDEEELRKEVENSTSSSKRSKRTLIKFDIDDGPQRKRSRSGDRRNPNETSKILDSDKDSEDDRKPNARERDENMVNNELHKIKTSRSGGNKYDNLPSLSSAIAVTDIKSNKKERCKFYPSCGKGERCEFIHPSLPCKAFPNCKFGDLCLYLHPKCKFDLTCSRLGCNFTHTTVATSAPPLSSHVVPVTNYKKIVSSPLPALCKFYPKCSNTVCEFYHPKLCKFGKNCTNKIECNFYHFDLPSVPTKNKLKWVASDA